MADAALEGDGGCRNDAGFIAEAEASFVHLDHLGILLAPAVDGRKRDVVVPGDEQDMKIIIPAEVHSQLTELCGEMLRPYGHGGVLDEREAGTDERLGVSASLQFFELEQKDERLSVLLMGMEIVRGDERAFPIEIQTDITGIGFDAVILQDAAEQTFLGEEKGGCRQKGIQGAPAPRRVDAFYDRQEAVSGKVLKDRAAFLYDPFGQFLMAQDERGISKRHHGGRKIVCGHA